MIQKSGNENHIKEDKNSNQLISSLLLNNFQKQNDKKDLGLSPQI